ncbi:prepilin-type N-terminal cleavage/methylation domain-containing protein [Prosthecobacter fluviatilis]|uniref:Prepilin-type N-terminal cleavage/methylation domain-containing protein n=1 Tax=Prosthecobacter fluviatilis TaxID=445931 RepID=A0ABW0KSJ2_9BACT
MKTHRQPATRAFTLIELLITITIIAILASLTAAGVTQLIDKANNLKVRTVLMDLKTGIETYQTDYNRYPVSAGFTGANGEDAPELLTDGSNPLVDTLMGIPPASGGTADLNPKRTQFATFNPANNGRHGLVGAARPYKLTDMYGQPYHILLDTNGDNQVKNPDAANTDPKISTGQAAHLPLKIAVYSSGKDQIPGTSDDVTSWRPK